MLATLASFCWDEFGQAGLLDAISQNMSGDLSVSLLQVSIATAVCMVIVFLVGVGSYDAPPEHCEWPSGPISSEYRKRGIHLVAEAL